jgi:D-tagatose-1,6-bisphosphate aldolase subunit GatZ/KbaZ
LPADAMGLPSFCTAHPGAIRALLAHGARRGLPVLIEATCNQ